MTIALVIILVALALMSGKQLAQLGDPIPETVEEQESQQFWSTGCVIVIIILGIIGLMMVAAGAAAGG